jgi:superfamily II DNA or RNA helicase
MYPRRLLYYKTGAGKSITALAMVWLWGCNTAVVITPPSTYSQWEEAATKFGMTITCMSHAKFRQKDTKLDRRTPVIADEFHLFGGHGGKGWKKLDALSRGLKAPMVLASATPNYNDAERVYCIQHVLAPHTCKGGYLEFLYQHCNTHQNPFGTEPLVDDDQPFRNYATAAEYLADLPNVDYLADDLVYAIKDTYMYRRVPTTMTEFGLNERKDRIIASQMEERHAVVDHSLLDSPTLLRTGVREWVSEKIVATQGPVIVFAAHQTVARALQFELSKQWRNVAIVDGSVTTSRKAEVIADFRDKKINVLIGTASLATGTDGLDKVCDTLVIVDDTDDDALRRQLIGRIMPRGADTDASKKHVYRLVLV